VKYFYSEIDHIVTTFNDIHKDDHGIEYLRVYHERPSVNCFDYLETRLPDLNVVSSQGFSDDEVKNLLQYTRNNAALLWEIAREEGGKVAHAS